MPGDGGGVTWEHIEKSMWEHIEKSIQLNRNINFLPPFEKNCLDGKEDARTGRGSMKQSEGVSRKQYILNQSGLL